jgi:hypothetical protein
MSVSFFSAAVVQSFSRAWLAAAAASLTLAVAGCSATPDVQGPKASLPIWQGDFQLLYPNRIDPAAFDMTEGVKATKEDKVLWARSTTADVVGRAHIRTVSRPRHAGVEMYVLGLEFDNPPLATPKVNQSQFDLTVGPTDEAYGMLKVHDVTRSDGHNALSDQSFVAFVKRFAGPDDEIDVHFYLYPDSKDVASVVQEAVALEEVKAP